MPEYYFDIETAPKEEYRNEERAGTIPLKARIISIQYQELDSRTGLPKGELKILKEWEHSENGIIQKFKPLFVDTGEWGFIPIGNNLLFEFKFMKQKLKEYCNLDGLRLGHRPMIDLKHLLIIANNGSFKGYDKLLGKSDLAANMADWYYDKNWQMIEQYIRQETKDFLEVYAMLKRQLPAIFNDKR